VAGDVRGDLPVEVLLPIHLLGDRLDDQVATVEQVQPGVVVGGDDPLGQCLVGERGGAELGQSGNRLVDHAVGVAFLRRQVEQHSVDAGVGQVGGDLRAHHTGAENGRAAYK